MTFITSTNLGIYSVRTTSMISYLVQTLWGEARPRRTTSFNTFTLRRSNSGNGGRGSGRLVSCSILFRCGNYQKLLRLIKNNDIHNIDGRGRLLLNGNISNNNGFVHDGGEKDSNGASLDIIYGQFSTCHYEQKSTHKDGVLGISRNLDSPCEGDGCVSLVEFLAAQQVRELGAGDSAPIDGDGSILEQEGVKGFLKGAGCRSLKDCSEMVLGPLREGGENDFGSGHCEGKMS